MDFRNLDRRGPVFQFRLSYLFLASAWVAVVAALHEYPWIAAGAGGLMVIVYLHYLSLGRTSPVAAFSFIGSWAFAAFCGGIRYVVADMQGKESVRLITDEDMQFFAVATLCCGLVAAAIATVIVAFDKRHEWFNHI